MAKVFPLGFINLFVVLVGESSKARKGTSWNQIRRLFAEVDRPWVTERVTTARLTPAALIYSLRDQQPSTDRRLLALSEEFAAVLHSLRRAKGHLSPLLRCAWDSGDLRSLGGLHPIQATGTHITHIIRLPHLQAALAVWDYCSASASLFFGTSTGDHTADRILEAINTSSDGSLSRNQMSALFHGHVSSSRIEAALEQLIALGAIYKTSQPSGGRPSTLWSAMPGSECSAERL